MALLNQQWDKEYWVGKNSHYTADPCLVFMQTVFWIRGSKYQGKWLIPILPTSFLWIGHAEGLYYLFGETGKEGNIWISQLPALVSILGLRTLGLTFITSIRKLIVDGGYNGCDVGPCWTMVGCSPKGIWTNKQGWSLFSWPRLLGPGTALGVFCLYHLWSLSKSPPIHMPVPSPHPHPSFHSDPHSFPPPLPTSHPYPYFIRNGNFISFWRIYFQDSLRNRHWGT